VDDLGGSDEEQQRGDTSESTGNDDEQGVRQDDDNRQVEEEEQAENGRASSETAHGAEFEMEEEAENEGIDGGAIQVAAAAEAGVAEGEADENGGDQVAAAGLVGVAEGVADENGEEAQVLDPWELWNNAADAAAAAIQVAPVNGPAFQVPFQNHYTRDKVDKPDKVFEVHGHVIGLTLSPDHRFLFVNVRHWPADANVDDWHDPPSISEEIRIHVIDLVKLESLGPVFSSHRAFTTNFQCFFIFLSVSADFVASGAEDKNGYVWDRRYPEIQNTAILPHENVVNSIAFNPSDQEMVVSVSDDHTVRIWRSKRKRKELLKAGLVASAN